MSPKGRFLEAILRSPKTVFTLKDVALLWGEPASQAVRVRLNYYAHNSQLHWIRKGIYAKDRNYNRLELATRIFAPAYVSFETILAKEGLIFQYHSEITVASYLTREVEADGQAYVFKKIKDPILTHPLGVVNRDETSLATRERALLDTLYLHAEYQFDNLGGLDWNKVFEFLPIYQNQRMARTVQKLYKSSKERP